MTDDALPDPVSVLDLIEAFRRSKTMFAAVSLGVFDALEENAANVESLAKKLGCHADSLERLLHACVGLGLLEHTRDVYRNTPSASVYLTSSSPRRLTGYINYSNDVTWKLWEYLEQGIRQGSHVWKEAMGLEGDIFANLFRDDHAKREFLLGMHGYGTISSPVVAASFDLSRFEHLVDLGGATGHLAIAACERYPSLRATLFDLPGVIPLAKEIIGTSSVADRITLTPGDFFNDPLPKGDLYSLGRILHDWSEEKILRLLPRIFESLPSGGGILIAEKVLLADKSGPRWSQMQDLNMLLCTEGRERTLAEYESLLTGVGFVSVAGKHTDAPLDAVLALKP